MSEAAWRCTSALCAGRPLEKAIEVASAIDISTLLAEHLAAGRFIAFNITEPVAAAQAMESYP